jgi:hypothetical protein
MNIHYGASSVGAGLYVIRICVSVFPHWAEMLFGFTNMKPKGVHCL